MTGVNVGKYRCVKRSTEGSREHHRVKRNGADRKKTSNTHYVEHNSKKKKGCYLCIYFIVSSRMYYV